MKNIQPNLINFYGFQNIGLFSKHVSISEDFIIHTNRINCPICATLCNYNGSSNKGHHILSRSNGSLLRKGQQYCPNCNKTIQTDNPWIDNIITTFNEYLISQTLSLSNCFSEDEIVSHFEKTMSISISKSSVHNIINQSNLELEDIEFDYEFEDGFYGYDEQFLKIDGKRAYRLVFYDINNNKIIYEKIHYKFSKKLLKKLLIEIFGKDTPKGFVTDMRVEYPKAFKDVFGKKIKLQYCIFHLNKLILKEYRDALKIGKEVKWSLMHYCHMYSLFNIFYNREYELNLLEQLMKNYNDFKLHLNAETILHYVKIYDIRLKTLEKQKQKVLEIIEKKFMKGFRKLLHEEKCKRRRNKLTLEVRSINSAKEIFSKIYKSKTIYPYKIQKRIERINKNFEYFIASEGIVLTNNKLEGLFGATLKKFRKKSRKSLMSFSGLLKRKRLTQEGKDFFRRFTIYDLAVMFNVLTFFS